MFNNNIKYCRESLEMTQKELGYVFGVTEGAISNWENGNDNIPFRKLVRFCNLYNFSIDYVLGLKRFNENYEPLNNINSKLIGQNIKKLRKELNLSQKEFSNQIKYPNTTICNFESGYRLINTLCLYTICKTYNISADILVGRKKK